MASKWWKQENSAAKTVFSTTIRGTRSHKLVKNVHQHEYRLLAWLLSASLTGYCFLKHSKKKGKLRLYFRGVRHHISEQVVAQFDAFSGRKREIPASISARVETISAHRARAFCLTGEDTKKTSTSNVTLTTSSHSITPAKTPKQAAAQKWGG